VARLSDPDRPEKSGHSLQSFVTLSLVRRPTRIKKRITSYLRF
jgi:hypothetical protein